MKVPLLDLKAQYSTLRDEIRHAIDEVCDAQYFILGPAVEAFERNIAAYCGTRHAVGVSSGTDALLAALMALDIGPGDAVLTTPYSFFATAGCIARLGATPVFADIDPDTFNLDPSRVRALLEQPPAQLRDRTLKAMIPVHLFGQTAAMDELMELAREFKFAVVEDAAQAIGSEYPSAAGSCRAGSMGDMGCFSFFPSKNLGGFGDGGMVTTNSDALAQRLKRLRNHGAEPKYYHREIGGNFRLDALQAAVLDVKLRHLDRWHARRAANARHYNDRFEGTSVQAPRAAHADTKIKNHHIYNQYVVRVPHRDAVRDQLKAADIGCEVYYPVPLHCQACFRDLGYTRGDLPVSERAADETLALPIYPELTPAMQEHVAATLLSAVPAAGTDQEKE